MKKGDRVRVTEGFGTVPLGTAGTILDIRRGGSKIFVDFGAFGTLDVSASKLETVKK